MVEPPLGDVKQGISCLNAAYIVGLNYVEIAINLFSLLKILLFFQQVDKITKENEKFAENNRKLEEQNTKFAEQNKQLESSVSDLKEQAEKFKAIYVKLQAENEKLARVRDDMQEQLAVSGNISLLVFYWCTETVHVEGTARPGHKDTVEAYASNFCRTSKLCTMLFPLSFS